MRPRSFDPILAELLSQKGVQVNRRCNKGWTILHYFANTFKHYVDDGRFIWGDFIRQSLVHLLDRGVDRHIKDVNGLSALQIVETSLSQDHTQVREAWWDHYVYTAKEMMAVLQDYFTAPDQSRERVDDPLQEHLKWLRKIYLKVTKAAEDT